MENVFKTLPITEIYWMTFFLGFFETLMSCATVRDQLREAFHTSLDE